MDFGSLSHSLTMARPHLECSCLVACIKDNKGHQGRQNQAESCSSCTSAHPRSRLTKSHRVGTLLVQNRKSQKTFMFSRSTEGGLSFQSLMRTPPPHPSHIWEFEPPGESPILKVLIKKKKKSHFQKIQRHAQTDIPPTCPICFLTVDLTTSLAM